MSIPREELEQIFKKADIDQDGFVVPPEIILAGGQYTGLLKSWISGDTDKDKRLSLEEFLKYMEQKQAQISQVLGHLWTTLITLGLKGYPLTGEVLTASTGHVEHEYPFP